MDNKGCRTVLDPQGLLYIILAKMLIHVYLPNQVLAGVFYNAVGNCKGQGKPYHRRPQIWARRHYQSCCHQGLIWYIYSS